MAIGKKSEKESRANKILRNWKEVVTMNDYRVQKRYISNFVEAGKFIFLVLCFVCLVRFL
ncbi:hypothetical protein RCS94_06550 [Orbaceae bacterium ac157xtp]